MPVGLMADRLFHPVSMNTDAFSGVILAGGHGSRLGGVNKALLEVGGRPNVARVLEALGPLCQDLVIVANDLELASWPGVRLVLDREPHAGVLPALAEGLAAAGGERAIVVACDMPFLSTALLRDLVQRSAEVDVVIPVVDGRPEPMHAVYRRLPCLEAIRAALAAGERRMISFLDRLRVERVDEANLRALDPELRSFFNTNTPEDLALARSLAREEE
jgi:molybdopterin-guanine dinucleotide biosynthesis protein A